MSVAGRVKDVSLFIHDELLGHVPNPGFCTPGASNSFHTIDTNGLRHTGTDPGAGEQGAILAVGDSYTYGDEVRDEETWPAQLQRLTGRRVLNGGVTGYGFDQIVLRAEQLTAQHKPAVLIVSFIAHDIVRTEWRRLWWLDKPWFAIEGTELVLKGVPVPQRKKLPAGFQRWIQDVVVGMPWHFQTLVGYHARAHPSGHGLVLAERLIGRLARLGADTGVKIIVMAQHEHTTWITEPVLRSNRRIAAHVLDCAAAHGLGVLDTFQRFATEPNPLDFYSTAHMNARGNAAIASLLAATMPALLERQTSPGPVI
jgi:lysophospholipase L1-like esterase